MGGINLFLIENRENEGASRGVRKEKLWVLKLSGKVKILFAVTAEYYINKQSNLTNIWIA